jgi:hypothetical protein
MSHIRKIEIIELQKYWLFLCFAVGLFDDYSLMLAERQQEQGYFFLLSLFCKNLPAGRKVT